ncbi:hypothetical protein [Paraburkholderia sp. J7]|nr:hypothetical protein [Paraburkholderia sp. J7]
MQAITNVFERIHLDQSMDADGLGISLGEFVRFAEYRLACTNASHA